jgi:capsular exopolysaccharide synthesis family protein
VDFEEEYNVARQLEWSETESADPSDTPVSHDLWGMVIRRKWLILLGAVIGPALGYLYAVQRQPVFQSDAQVLVVRKRMDALPVQGVAALSFYDDYLPTHMRLIRSPVIVEQAVQDHQLQTLPSFAISANPTGSIVGALTVTCDTKEASIRSSSNILTLSYRGTAAGDCEKVLNAVIQSYSGFLGQTYQDVSDRALKLITEAEEVLKKGLEQKEQAYLEFRQNAPLLWKGKEGANIHQERLAIIETARSGLLVRRAEGQGRLEAFERAIASGVNRASLAAMATRTSNSSIFPSSTRTPTNPDDPLLPLLVQEQVLLEDYGPDHPQIASVRRRIELTREFVKKGEEARKNALLSSAAEDSENDPIKIYVASLRAELDEIRVLERELTDLFTREQAEARALTDYEIEDETYRKDIERTQLLYDGIIKRLQEMDLVKDYGGYTTQIVSPPTRGVQVEPKTYRIVLLGLLLGAFGGCALAYWVDVADKSFRSPEEIHGFLGLPVVGHIPHMVPIDSMTDEAVLDPLIYTFHRPKSFEAESYREVRTALYFSTRGNEHRVIQVTSPDPSAGKTTLACNLAVCIAQSGKKVLLVDADFRRPRLHKVFAMPHGGGLSSVLAGDMELPDAVRTVGIPNLWILPCGKRPANPAELLTSSRFSDLVQVVREQYDFVLLDTPPVLVVTDPCVVAARVDGVILVIQVGRNGRPSTQRAREMLGSIGAKLLGVVVNRVGSRSGAKNGYYRSYYNYQYGNGYRAYTHERSDEDSQLSLERDDSPVEESGEREQAT